MTQLLSRSALTALLVVIGFLTGCEPAATPPAAQVDTTAPAPAPVAEKRPNFLLVMADDMGWTDIGSYGGEIETPNLDALAQQGVKFTDFHVSVSCSPTRSMLLSGNDNHVAGLGNMGEVLAPNQIGQPGYEGHLNERVASLAEVLREGGYHTYMAGKWHLGKDAGTRPFDRGFERSLSMLVGAASHWNDMLGILPMDDPALYSQNGELLDELPADFYSSESYADYLIESISENQGDGKPFLAYLAFTAPHDPMHAPEPWLSKYRGKYDEGYESLKTRRWESAKKLRLVPQDAALAEPLPQIRPWDELSDGERAVEVRGMEVYAGMVDAMDHHFGRVVDFLREIGEYDNTVIIFLSDNGANPWYSDQYPGADEPEFRAKFDNSLENIGKPGSNYSYGIGFASGSGGPLDRFKLTVGEGGIRSPLLIAGPGIQAGQQSDAFAYVWDVMPTILEMAGLEYPTELAGRELEAPRGRSMLGLLDGTTDTIYDAGEFIGGEMMGGKWMRQGDFKAVLVPAPYGSGTWQLFNVVDDPGESRNLAQDMPDKLEALISAWDNYALDVGVIPAE